MTKTPAISPLEASEIIQGRILKYPVEWVGRRHCYARVLVDDVYAATSMPRFSRVCMDGIAVAHDPYRIEWAHQSLQSAGDAVQHLESSQHAIEVATGAVCPQGAELVIPYEQLVRKGESWFLREPLALLAGKNIQAEGSEVRAGARLVAGGTTLLTPELSLLTAQGIEQVLVYRKPRISLISNGSELVSPEKIPAAHQIRDVNSIALESLLEAYGYQVFHRALVADDRGALEKALQEAFELADVIVISAGVSQGPRDLVPQVLKDFGLQFHFTGVEQKPGRPFSFGTLGEDRFVFGLPGNPLAALFNAAYYLVPFLRSLEKKTRVPRQRVMATALAPQQKASFFPVRETQEGGLEVMALKGSADLAGLVGSCGIIAVPAQMEIQAGDRVAFFPWSFEALL